MDLVNFSDNDNTVEKLLLKNINELNLKLIPDNEINSLEHNTKKYYEGLTLIKKSEHLIDILKNQILDLEKDLGNIFNKGLEQNDNIDDILRINNQINKMIKLIKLPNITFDEVLNVITEFKNIQKNIPSKATIREDIHNEIIYDDES